MPGLRTRLGARIDRDVDLDADSVVISQVCAAVGKRAYRDGGRSMHVYPLGPAFGALRLRGCRAQRGAVGRNSERDDKGGGGDETGGASEHGTLRSSSRL